MPETITVGDTLRIYLPASAGTLGDVTVTFPAPIGAVLGDVAADETINGVLSHVRLFPAASGLAVGDYPLPVTVVLGDSDPVTVPLDLTVQAVQGALPFPDHLLSIAAWRLRLRSKIFDTPLPGVDDPTASVVLSDAALDEALREALSALSVYRPVTRPLPPLTLTPGQTVYPLPADFSEPVEETWGALLAPNGVLSGRYIGSRYALLRREGILDAPAPVSNRGAGAGYGGYWAGRSYDGTLPLMGQDAQGNIGAIPLRPTAALYPAGFDSPTPFLALSPAPTQAHTFSALTYRAAHLPRRLTVNDAGTDWARDADNNLVFTLAPLGQDFDDATDVLPFAASDDAVRLVTRYATAWTLTEKVLSFAETEGEQWAFYQVKSGLGRKDIQRIADDAMKEFDRRVTKTAFGRRG